MTIHLVTGEPGDGKTNLAITMVKERAEQEKRQVYCSGITILDPVALPWIEINPQEWFSAPVGSIVILDECQATFEPRMRGKTQPPFARELETHRHSGIDLYLITQHPTLLDAHDRKLVGLHYYVRRKMGTAWKTVYTFKGCADYPEKQRAKALDSREAVDNKAAFGWYKSTELNTTKRSIPFRVWLLLALVIAVPALLGTIAWNFKERRKVVQPHAASGLVQGSGVVDGLAAGHMAGGGAPRSPVATTAEYVASFLPRVPGLAHTAPAYDQVTAVKAAPYPAACLTSGSRCGCYTQQGTVLDVPDPLCRSIVSRGFFIAWLPDAAPVPVNLASGKRVDSGGPGNRGSEAPGGIGGATPDVGSLQPLGPLPERRTIVGGGVLRSAVAAPPVSSVATGGAP